MKKGLRYTLYFVSLLWLLVIVGFVGRYCGEPDAHYLVVGLGPAATVGTIAFIIEYRCERGDHD